MKISYTVVLGFLMFITGSPTFSQSKFKNGAFLELGGNSLAYSVNYERQFFKSFNSRFGVSYVADCRLFTLTIGKVYGNGNNHLEIDGGVVFDNYPYIYNQSTRDVRRFNALFATGFVGYRFQKPDHRFFFRGGLTFLWRTYDENITPYTPWNFMPWAGISFGYRF